MSSILKDLLSSIESKFKDVWENYQKILAKKNLKLNLCNSFREFYKEGILAN